MIEISRERATTQAQQLYVGMREGLIGVDEQIQQLTWNIMSNRHALLEGIPGTGKTTLTDNFSNIIIPAEGRNAVGRFQGVGDSLPSDVTGSMVFNQETGKMEARLGPVDAHLLFADEINRAPGKTQNAINQAAQEKKVTIGGTDYYLPSPFLVVGTQNSHEQGEATYPTTSALLDRFAGSIYFGAPSRGNKLLVANSNNLERELMMPDELAARERKIQRMTAVDLLSVMRRVGLTPVEEEAQNRALDIEERLVAMKGVALISGGDETGMGYRFVNDAMRLAKARAVFEGKEVASAADVDVIAPMVFSHRIRSIDHNAQVSYPHKLEVVADAMRR